MISVAGINCDSVGLIFVFVFEIGVSWGDRWGIMAIESNSDDGRSVIVDFVRTGYRFECNHLSLYN